MGKQIKNCLYRIMIGGLEYWQVRIKRRGKGGSKTFSFAGYGGNRKAKKAAIAYREKLLRTLPPPRRGKIGKSGHYGIHETAIGYRAIFKTTNGYGKSKIFRFDKYGTMALKLAIDFREEGLKLKLKGPFRVPLKHGMLTMYQHYGCRCDPCCEINRQYNKASKLNRKERVAAGLMPKSIKHCASTYTNWGCRCVTCSEDHAQGLRIKRRNAKKV